MSGFCAFMVHKPRQIITRLLQLTIKVPKQPPRKSLQMWEWETRNVCGLGLGDAALPCVAARGTTRVVVGEVGVCVVSLCSDLISFYIFL